MLHSVRLPRSRRPAGLRTLLAVLLLAAPAAANNGGIPGFSSNPATEAGRNCNFCHNGGTAPIVTLSGPQVVNGGETHTYTFTVAGGQGVACGLDVSSDEGGLTPVDADTRLFLEEITHNAPRAVDTSGDCVFTFDWTAPFVDAVATLYASGNSVNLDATTGGDLAASTQLAVTVMGAAPGSIPPTADADGPHSGLVGTPIAFDGTGSSDPDGSIVAWDWDFGDGGVGSGPTPMHTYLAAGDHTVTLTVTDDDGFTGTGQTQAHIVADPPALRAQRIIRDRNLRGGAYVTSPPGDDRLFVVRPKNVDFEPKGRIYIVRDDGQPSQTFLEIDPVGTDGAESGIRGLAFAPDFADSGAFYVLYSDVNEDTVVSRFYVLPGQPDIADPTSEEVIISLPQPGVVHHGSHIEFGPDGMLYVGFGDGGTGAQGIPGTSASPDPTTLLGKLVRLDVSGGGPGYAIPSDNPFVGPGAPLDEIWAFGLRNPFSFHFDRTTGDLYIGDVGQATWEEVNVEPAGSPGGRDFGWDVMEGDECRVSPAPPECSDGSLTLPVHFYAHTLGRCSITGGSVYRGVLPDLQGRYFFADYCSHQIWSLVWDGAGGVSDLVDHTAELLPDVGEIENVVAIQPDGFGEPIIYSRATGELFRIVSTDPDADGDFVPDALDNCPATHNRAQDDGDGDTLGDRCDDYCASIGETTSIVALETPLVPLGSPVVLRALGVGSAPVVELGGEATTTQVAPAVPAGVTAELPSDAIPGDVLTVALVNPEGCRSLEPLSVTVTAGGRRCGMLGIEPWLLIGVVAAFRRRRGRGTSLRA